MNVRIPLPRLGPIPDANTVCLRCWWKLSRAPMPRRQQYAKTATATTGKSRNSRNAFSRDYFWANAQLRESTASHVGGARRGLQSGLQSSGGGPSTASTPAPVEHAGLSPGSTAAEEGHVGDVQVGDGGDGGDVLPHRRRKRAGGPDSSFPIALDASSQLAELSTALPQRSLRRLFTTYLALSKPRLSFLVVLTATAAYSLYPVPGLLAPAATATPSLSTLTLFFLTTGTALASASANTLNMIFEPAHDAKMSRTKNRPLVRKLISTRSAWGFAIMCGAMGTGALFYGVNPTTAFLGAANIVLYAFVYTPLKRISVLNTWVGAIVGGIPPLMGWTAAAGQCAHEGTWQELLFGDGTAGGWLLAALLFAWQFPHFNSLSWSIRDEYKNAGYRMLAWVNPARNGRVAVRYAVLMFPVCIGLSYYGVTDMSFIVTSSAVNGWMAWKAVQFWRETGQKGTARGLFWASIWHLPLVMVLAMAQKKGLGERVYRSIFGFPAIDDDDLYYEDDEEEDQEEEEEEEAAEPTSHVVLDTKTA